MSTGFSPLFKKPARAAACAARPAAACACPISSNLQLRYERQAQQLEQLLAGVDAHLLVNVARVGLERTLGDEQLLLNDAAGLPLGQKRQHLLLPRTQAVGGARAPPRASAARSSSAVRCDEAALLQDGHAPLASQLLLGEQQHRGRQNEHRHNDRHRESLGGRRTARACPAHRWRRHQPAAAAARRS